MANTGPKLSYHKAAKRGFITWKGKKLYVKGSWPSDKEKPPPEVLTNYHILVHQLLYQTDPPQEIQPQPPSGAKPAVSLWVAVDRYLAHIEKEYAHNPIEVGNIERAVSWLCEFYGNLSAADFSPLCLKVLQKKIAERPWKKKGWEGEFKRTRQGVNKIVNRIRSAFRWMASEMLVPASVVEALGFVEPLRLKPGGPPEFQRKGPVADEVVAATLAHLPRAVRAMVQIIQYCGCRPSELCILRTSDIDRTGPVWFYKPSTHKNLHRGKPRLIPFGPRCQAVLTEWLRLDDPDAFVFSPARERQIKFAEMRATRKTPVQPSQISRAKVDGKRLPGEAYETRALNHAVKRACKAGKIPVWSVGQLRKTHADRAAAAVDVDAARSVLGHASSDTTQAYYLSYERAKAEAAALAIG